MIEVSITGLEQLCDQVTGILSDTEELLVRAEALKSEIDVDVQLAAYPQYTPLLELLGSIISNVSRVDEALQTLQIVFGDAVEEYKEQESSFARQLDTVISAVSALGLTLSAAETTDVKPIENDAETESCDGLQQMVASANEEMQITNIAAVTTAIEEEYTVSGSTSRVLQDVADSAFSVEVSVAEAQGIHIDDSEEEALPNAASNVRQNVADSAFSVEASAAAAQSIHVEDSEE